MKLSRFLLVFSILQLLCLYQTNADSLNAVRVIVNGEIITEFDVKKRISEAFKMAEKKYSDLELQGVKREIISDAIDELIDRKILVQEAKRSLLSDPEKAAEIEKNLELFVKGAIEEVGSTYKFYEIANKQGINPLKKRNELRKDLMVEEILRENVYSKILITPKKIKRYYQEHIDEFSRKEQLSFRQILIKFSAYDTKEEAKSRAEKLLKRARNGEEFGALAEKYSQGPHSSEGGLWGFDEVRDFRKDFIAAISNLKKDEISGIIDSSIGYHIFKVEEIIPAQTLSFQQAQDKINNTLFREQFLEKKKEYLKELRKNVVIKKYY